MISGVAQKLLTPVTNSYILRLSIPVTNENIHFIWLFHKVKTFIKTYHETITGINILCLCKQFLKIPRNVMVSNLSKFSSSKWKLFYSNIIRRHCAEAIRNVIILIVRKPRDNSFQCSYNLSFHNLSVVSKCMFQLFAVMVRILVGQNIVLMRSF